MNKLKFVFLAIIFTLVIGFMSYKGAFALFSDTATSTNNVFSASQTFPTSTPSPTPPPQIAQTLVINEILPHSTCFQGNTENQFVELWNGTGGDVNLQSFKFSDGTNVIAVSNSSVILPSHAFAILVKDGGLIGKNKCITDVNGAITPNLGGQIDLSATTLQLLDNSSNVIDVVKFGTNSATTIPIPPTDKSVQRVPTGEDTALGASFAPSDFNFGVSGTPSPGL